MTRLFAGTPFDRPPRCERCGALEADCRCPPPPVPAGQQTARLRLEKRKRGKIVTVIDGLPAIGNNLPELLSRLKVACGAGGTLKDESLEIQGDHLLHADRLLAEWGFRTKR